METEMFGFVKMRFASGATGLPTTIVFLASQGAIIANAQRATIAQGRKIGLPERQRRRMTAAAGYTTAKNAVYLIAKAKPARMPAGISSASCCRSRQIWIR